MTVEATPLVVEKLRPSVSGVQGRLPAASALPTDRSTTVCPRRRTTTAPPPDPRPSSRAKARATGAKCSRVVPRKWVTDRTLGPRAGTRASARSLERDSELDRRGSLPCEGGPARRGAGDAAGPDR